MKSIIVPFSLNKQPIQIFVEKIESINYSGGVNGQHVHIGASGNYDAYIIPVTDSNDAAALINQINNAFSSTEQRVVCSGNPSITHAPTSLTLSAQYGAIGMTWNPGQESICSYRIYRQDGAGSFVAIVETAGTSYTDTNLDPAVTYSYYVIPFTSRGDGPQSTTQSASPLNPPTPANLTGTAGYYSVSLLWNSVTTTAQYGNLYYIVYRDGNQIYTTSNTTYDDLGIDGGSHSYQVSAFIDYVEGAKSSSVSVTPNALPAPSGFTVSAGVYSASLSWSAVTGADSYDVYRSTSSGAEALISSGVTGTSFVDTALDYGVQYFYKVSASANGLSGPLSAEGSAIPTAATFVSASPNPASISGGTLTFTGSGFDSSQSGLISYGTVQVNYLPVTYINSNTISVTAPGGLNAGSIQFYYNVGNSVYQIPFLVDFA
jgi:hypothetical protein